MRKYSISHGFPDETPIHAKNFVRIVRIEEIFILPFADFVTQTPPKKKKSSESLEIKACILLAVSFISHSIFDF